MGRGGARKGAGRPVGTVKQVDVERLRTLAMIGTPIAKMAPLLGVSHDTLELRFREQIELARGDGETRILGKIFQLALGGNVRCLELCAINRCAWVNRPEVMVNVTQNTLTVPNITAQTKEKLSQLHQLIRREALLTGQQTDGFQDDNSQDGDNGQGNAEHN